MHNALKGTAPQTSATPRPTHRKRSGLSRLLLCGMASLATCTALTAGTATAQVTSIADPSLNDRVSLGATGQPVSGDISLAAGQSRVLQFDANVGHSLIADPEVADLVPMTDRSLYLLGKGRGMTTLTLFDDSKRLLGVFKVNVTHDIEQLKRAIYELAPSENIEVRQNGDAIVLSGTASSPSVANLAERLAQQHGVSDVMNAVTTSGSKQVMLQVRIAEVQRTLSKRMNLSTNAFYDNGRDALDFVSGVLDAETFARGLASIRMGEFDVGFVFDALEREGLLTTLAEPNLVAMSGESAYFLAGGEFPVPVGRNNNGQIEIEFKEFGVRLAYTPTIIGDTINLVIEPEVSTLDPANGLVLDTFVIPGLTTRRASTTVELKNGQSFAIAGLLQDTFENDFRGIPGIMNLPIIGALARSPSYEREETELLIVVTPYLVEPYEGSDYAMPQDYVQRPTDQDMFLNGIVEKGRTP